MKDLDDKKFGHSALNWRKLAKKCTKMIFLFIDNYENNSYENAIKYFFGLFIDTRHFLTLCAAMQSWFIIARAQYLKLVSSRSVFDCVIR